MLLGFSSQNGGEAAFANSKLKDFYATGSAAGDINFFHFFANFFFFVIFFCFVLFLYLGYCFLCCSFMNSICVTNIVYIVFDLFIDMKSYTGGAGSIQIVVVGEYFTFIWFWLLINYLFDHFITYLFNALFIRLFIDEHIYLFTICSFPSWFIH